MHDSDGRANPKYPPHLTPTRVYTDAVLGQVGDVTRWPIRLSALAYWPFPMAEKLTG